MSPPPGGLSSLRPRPRVVPNISLLVSSRAEVAANGVVYFGSWSTDNSVYALNASTGALLWKYKTGLNVKSSPTVTNGVVYVGSDDNNVYALNAINGALL